MQATGLGRKGRGFTLIELLVVMAIVALLAGLVAPRYLASLDRAKEAALRSSLSTLRDAIDQYVADKGRYPDSLLELAEARYIRAVPEDPITGERESWLELPPPAETDLEGQLYDVRSGAPGQASDGSLYADW